MALTISDKKISLWIAGNQFGSKGFENLVLIKPQFPPLQFEGMPGVESNPYYFVINIAEDYTQYTLVCNKVTTADGESGGVLKIAIGIPKNHRIVGGFTSPFDVLAKLREVFVGTYMNPTPGTKEAYTYKSVKPEESVFANILNGYNLEETHMVHRPMNGKEPALAVLTPGEIKRLFKDVQYQEFTPFKDVVVATFADETQYPDRVLKGLEVPRRPKFTLFVNDEQVKWPVKDIFNDMITLRSNGDERFYINRSVTFTVNDLMSGKTYRGITMDLVKEEIRITLKAEPRKTVFRIDLEGTDNERHRMDHIRIGCNGKPVTVMNGQFALTGEELQFKNSLQVAYEGTDYKIVDKKWYGDVLRVTVTPVAPKASEKLAATPTPQGAEKKADRPASKPGTPAQAPAKPASGGGAVPPASASPRPVTAARPEVNAPTFSRVGQEIKDEPKSAHQWLPTILIGLIMLVVGFVIGYFTGRPGTVGAEAAEDLADTTTVVAETPAEPSEPAPAAVDMSSVNLDDLSLTFAQVKEAYKKAQASNAQGPEMEKLSTLNAIVAAIEARDYDNIKKLGDNWDSPIAYEQLWAVREIYYGWRDDRGPHEYTAESIKQAKEAFESGKFASFVDLTTLHAGKGEYKKGSDDLKKLEEYRMGRRSGTSKKSDKANESI